ncbi:MAG: hypothetical protein CFE37_00720 [Alphaproteobacteria bacterium PA4]|nr:MAG: hypothetical protein CFE37_00720 [Alphaproteobacteria bacterium PA4]
MARRDRYDEDEDAPWLAEADPAARTEVSKRSLFWTITIILSLATAAVIGGVLLFAQKSGGSTDGYMNAEQAPLIEAEPGPYKIAPKDPSGLQVEGQGGVIYDAGAGGEVASTIDPNSGPEAPLPLPGTVPATPPATGVPRDLLPQAEAVQAPLPAPPPVTKPPAVVPPKAVPAAPVKPPNSPEKPREAPKSPPAKPVDAPKPPVAKPAEPPKPAMAKPAAGKAGTVQLGAFSSPEKAENAWAAMAGKAGLTGKKISAVEKDGKTLYRLRGSASDTAAACAALKASGNPCSVVE